MNIVKLQNELKGVPDDALIGYVQNPTGQVPTYLALSELQRRKEMRNNYQAAKPEKTVAQGLVDQAQPQPMQQGIAAVAPPQPAPMPQAPMAPPQGMADGGEVHYADGGIAGLDTGNMYDEQIYAQGGIVAFADGGDTVKPRANIQPFTDEEGQIRAAQYMAGLDVGNPKLTAGVDMAGIINKAGITDPRLHNLHAHYMTDAGNKYGATYVPDAQQIMFDRTSKEGNSLGVDFAPGRAGVHGQYSFDDGGEVKHYDGTDGSVVQADDESTSWLGRNIGTPLKNWYQREHDQMALDDEIEKYKLEKGVMPWTATTQAQRDAYDTGLTQLQAKRKNIISPPTPQSYPSGDKIPGSNVPGNQKEMKPEVKPEEKKNLGPFADTSKLLKPVTVATPKEQSLHDYVESYKKEIGDDPAKASRESRLKAMEDRAAKEEERAPWMALAQAGLGMAAGTSPNAILNIAQGATAGLKDYSTAKDKLATLEEKRYALMDAAAKADREAHIAAVQYGKGSMEHKETLANQIAIQNSQNATQMQIANLNQSVNSQYKQAEQIAKIRDDARENLKLKLKDESIDPATFDQLLKQEEARIMIERGYSSGTIPQQALPQGVKVTRLK
jgi:hypothetical protein